MTEGESPDAKANGEYADIAVTAAEKRLQNNLQDEGLLDSRGGAVGVSKKQADPLSCEDESRLWDSNTITTETSQGLSYGAFFYNCKLFGLRGMDEHQRLMLDQYKFGTDNNGRYLRYCTPEDFQRMSRMAFSSAKLE
ncbi:Hypp6799 [Branchiostoma lanceolatum]|uniref:Hypp6799 protein n=1 Tax=Branchiostoma lanceolatum TaxID=7740 RepID=A0A8J9YVQ4_BRALA|nr:Hypp6799 [Branchiostoma lanceolatum]